MLITPSITNNQFNCLLVYHRSYKHQPVELTINNSITCDYSTNQLMNSQLVRHQRQRHQQRSLRLTTGGCTTIKHVEIQPSLTSINLCLTMIHG